MRALARGVIAVLLLTGTAAAEETEDAWGGFEEEEAPEAARKIVDFRPDAETQARIDELAAKADTGRLSDDERAQYHAYVEVFDLVAILKSKARSVLAQNGS